MRNGTLEVLGETYTVVTLPLPDDEHGQCDCEKKIIKLNCDAPPATLLHELLHAILFESGLSFVLEDRTEEAVVRAIEHGLVKADIAQFSG